MKRRYRLYRRHGTFYLWDNLTNKRESLKTTNKADAVRIVQAKNEALRTPNVNRQIAHAYFAATDPAMASRTWQHVMDEVAKLKHGDTPARWQRAMRERPFDFIRTLTVLETRPEHFIAVLDSGGVCSNIFLRRLQNAAVDFGWLPAPLIPRRQWPKIPFKDKRDITADEFAKILADERNPEWRAY